MAHINPLSAKPTKWSAYKLLECVWPFCGVGTSRVNNVNIILASLLSHECHSLSTISIDHMDISIQEAIFYVPEIVKNTAATFCPKQITLKLFLSDERICQMRTVAEYIKRTEQFKKTNKLVLSYYEHQTATTQTLGRYVKMKLKAADINKKILLRIQENMLPLWVNL